MEQALGVGDGQGDLECFNPWGHKESDTTEQLNWTELKYTHYAMYPSPLSLPKLFSSNQSPVDMIPVGIEQ